MKFDAAAIAAALPVLTASRYVQRQHGGGANSADRLLDGFNQPNALCGSVGPFDLWLRPKQEQGADHQRADVWACPGVHGVM
jgi:hypothetical protein